ncbi:HVA22-like protein e isoform X3 [Salvia miltiorrhiza]|uniref:HVA22-like protein e isoform X3 n=1 Tax=Salvia miltiorrhiza TaxID=226208 RepID=UPI0025AB6FA8|nr:HVA22-like protein e isoform X3 [Salvia miltiorrhiza]
MNRLWTLLTYLHSLAGPGVMLLYPLYASVVAIESASKVDDEQWLAYWILIPIWYDLKLAFVAWLVLPQFRGAAFIYEKFVREKVIYKYGGAHKSPKSKNKFVDFVATNKGEQEAY